MENIGVGGTRNISDWSPEPVKLTRHWGQRVVFEERGRKG